MGFPFLGIAGVHNDDWAVGVCNYNNNESLFVHLFSSYIRSVVQLLHSKVFALTTISVPDFSIKSRDAGFMTQ